MLLVYQISARSVKFSWSTVLDIPTHIHTHRPICVLIILSTPPRPASVPRADAAPWGGVRKLQLIPDHTFTRSNQTKTLMFCSDIKQNYCASDRETFSKYPTPSHTRPKNCLAIDKQHIDELTLAVLWR